MTTLKDILRDFQEASIKESDSWNGWPAEPNTRQANLDTLLDNVIEDIKNKLID